MEIDEAVERGEQLNPWDVEWKQQLEESDPSPLLEELLVHEIIFWQDLPVGCRFLKLHPRWLQQGTQSWVPDN